VLAYKKKSTPFYEKANYGRIKGNNMAKRMNFHQNEKGSC